MASSLPERMTVLAQSGEKASAAVIFLHGIGDTGEKTKSVFLDYLKGEGHPYIKIYFPTAPLRYFAARDRIDRHWFNAVRTGADCMSVKCSIEDAEDATDMIENIIASTGMPRERVVIGGFSQGGMASIYAAYVRKIKVAGVIGAGAGFPFYSQAVLDYGSTTKLLSLYGSKDAFIDNKTMDLSRQLFISKGIPLECWTSKTLGHALCVDYLEPTFEWLERVIPAID